MSITASAQALARLEPYLLLAKSSKGAAAARLIAEATAASGCYVFAELFAFDGIRELESDATYGSSFRLLQLFAYGSFAEFEQAPEGTYPALNEAQRDKLRQLTLVTLASQNRNLPYASLVVQLGLSGNAADHGRSASGSTAGAYAVRPLRTQATRQLEDVIIDAIYAGIISARLDQQRQRVEVEGVLGRDVRGDDEVAQLAASLSDWQSRTQGMVDALAHRIQEARQVDAAKAARREAYDAQIERTLSSMNDAKSHAHGGGGGPGNNPNATGSTGGHSAGLRAVYDRHGHGGDMEVDDDAGAMRKKKSSAGGPIRIKRSRA